jgi:hypothetical protein
MCFQFILNIQNFVRDEATELILNQSIQGSSQKAIDYDTVYVLYEELNGNSIMNSKQGDRTKYGNYPTDMDRMYNIIVMQHVHVWFKCFVNLPKWAEMPFIYHQVSLSFLSEKDFKDQEWFRNTPEEEIIDTFHGKDKVIYLVEKDRIKEGKAIMIRVYFDFPVEE